MGIIVHINADGMWAERNQLMLSWKAKSLFLGISMRTSLLIDLMSVMSGYGITGTTTVFNLVRKWTGVTLWCRDHLRREGEGDVHTIPNANRHKTWPASCFLAQENQLTWNYSMFVSE